MSYNLKTMNSLLHKLGMPNGFELVKADGYFYFDGPGTESWHTTMVSTFSLNQKTPAQWFEAFKELAPEGTHLVTKTNLMSGKEYKEPANTPLCCSPSSETYWSM